MIGFKLIHSIYILTKKCMNLVYQEIFIHATIAYVV